MKVKRKNNLRNILFVILFIFLFVVAFFYFKSSFLGKVIYSSSYSEIGFAPPVNVFSNNTLVFNVSPDYGSVTSDNFSLNILVNYPGALIYKQGYYWSNSTQSWKNFSFDESTLGNSKWIFSYANKTILIPASDLRVGNNLVSIYACKNFNGSWECGCTNSSDKNCRSWMLQIVDVTEFDLPVSCTSDSDCIIGKMCRDQLCVLSPRGSGTLEDPFLIYTCKELQNISSNLSANYVLASDIDCSETRRWNNGLGFIPIGNSSQTGSITLGNSVPFIGRLNGAGHTIHNLYINRPTQRHVGLIGFSTGNISQLHLINSNITGRSYVGGLVGYQYSGIISNSSSSGNVFGIGSSGNPGVGGLVGMQWQGSIYDCQSFGSVAGNYGMVGGLVGMQSYGPIYNSYSNCDVVARNMGAGGISGYSSNLISNSYAIGSVMGLTGVGGLVGQVSHGSVLNSYSTGQITGSSNVGGLIGYIEYLTISSSYYDSQTSGQSDTGKGEPKTTAEMKNQVTYSGWDFTNIWAIDSAKNRGYPYLRWQNL
jgi:hypothetical protein